MVPASSCCHALRSKEKLHRSLKGERPLLPPKAYIVSPWTTAVCPPRGEGGEPLTRTCAHSEVPKSKRKRSVHGK